MISLIQKIFLITLAGAGILMLSTCTKTKGELIIYQNDFETGNLDHFTNGAIDIFNNSHVLGRYNTSSFQLDLTDLPKHQILRVEFDLYIHDTWDGNLSFGNNEYGPDIWSMAIDSNTFIYTTFANTACPVGYNCPPQSYPLTYPATNNPRTGSAGSLPGVCALKGDPNGTSWYRIVKTFAHSSSTVSVKCLDHLKERDTADPKCAESWSIDNLKITAIQ